MPDRDMTARNRDGASGIAARIRRRQRTFGAWTSLGHPSTAEVFAASGVDFLGIDMEHSVISLEQAQRVIAAAHSGGAACLPRIASHSGEQITRLLDSGADGIIVPNVSTTAQIERLVEACKYPPLGRRSYGVGRAQGYGFEFASYVASWNDRSSLLIQIESVEGVEAAEALLAHPQVDGAMVGPYDISGSLGMPGQLTHSRVVEACERVVEACRRRGKACGTQLVEPTPEGVAAALARGYTFIVLASDVFLLWKWSEQMRGLIRGLRRPVRSRRRRQGARIP